MHLSSLVEIIESSFVNRSLLGRKDTALDGPELARLVRIGGTSLRDAEEVIYVGENHPLLPLAFLSAAWVGIPFVPLNYRMEHRKIDELIGRRPGALVLADRSSAQRIATSDAKEFSRWVDELTTATATADDGAPARDEHAVAAVLHTSGTTSEPKAALLRHHHLMAYLLGSVEFAGAAEDEAALVAVPPYHVAGLVSMLSNLFAGRRLVYLRSFEPNAWLATVKDERITNAMVVPTMLARIVDTLQGRPADVPSLRTLSYGGAKVPERVLAEALALFPETGFVNAYGLTETTSTIAVLGPEDHRTIAASDDPLVRRRLSSVGRLLPSVELEVRDATGRRVAVDEVGLIHLRGDQVAGEYADGSLLDDEGWFCTRDRGWVDDDGYLFVEGRADDTIIRGGENIAPAEIEEVLLADSSVVEACVVGLPDDEWGQQIAAVVVLRDGRETTDNALRDFVRAQLGGSRTPNTIIFRETLPYSETGKLLRRRVIEELLSTGERHVAKD